jgi:hypothetical protein
VLADPLTRPFFEGLDMEHQISKPDRVHARAFGGPTEYQGRDLAPHTRSWCASPALRRALRRRRAAPGEHTARARCRTSTGGRSPDHGGGHTGQVLGGPVSA